MPTCTLYHLVIKEEQWCKLPPIRFAWFFGAIESSPVCVYMASSFSFSPFLNLFHSGSWPAVRIKEYVYICTCITPSEDVFV